LPSIGEGGPGEPTLGNLRFAVVHRREDQDIRGKPLQITYHVRGRSLYSKLPGDRTGKDREGILALSSEVPRSMRSEGGRSLVRGEKEARKGGIPE